MRGRDGFYDKANWALIVATVLGLFGTVFASANAESARKEVAYLQGKLKVRNAEEELSKKTTDTCLMLVDVCNESLNVCVQNNEMLLRTCGGEPN